MSVYGYSNVPKAATGSPFYSNSGANPASANSTSGTASTMTVNADPRGILATVVLAASVHRDTGNGASGAGSNMTVIHTLGPNSSSANMTFVNEDRVSNRALGAVQAGAFTTQQGVWAVLTDVIDATP